MSLHDMNKEVYRHLLQTYGRNPGLWVGFVTEFIRTAIFRVYVGIAMAQVTASIASGDLDAAKRYMLFYFCAHVIGAIVGALGDMLSVHTENHQYGRLMMTFYKKLTGKDFSFYQDHQTGYLAGAFRQFLDSPILLVRFFRSEVLGALISLILPPVVLLFIAPKVGLVAVLVVAVQVVYVIWSSARLHPYRHTAHEIYRRVTGEVSDVVTNIVAFKASGAGDRMHDRMKGLAKEETEIFDVRRRMTILLDLPRDILTVLGITVAVYLILPTSPEANPTSLGLMVLTLTYMFQIIRNVGSLPELISRHDDLVTKVYPTLKYLSAEYEEVRDPKKPVAMAINDGAIDIDRISFHYKMSHRKDVRIGVFEDFTMHVRGGEHVGIVGLSGAGKSTLAHLILRFDDVESGSIKIDGVDIRDVKQSDLRKCIAYVPQEPLLFHRTIRENITYGCEHKEDEEIFSAAKVAHVHEFIERLPDGYDTVVGERGMKLSGGQKQRIVIARAVLKKAPMMIFDEATSALDSESERIIQRALPQIIEKRTAIIIAHRLSTVAGLDRILMIHEGKMIESGTHEELLALNGRYAALWRKQTVEFA